MDQGIDPNAERRREAAGDWQRFTLAEAIEEHVANMRTKKRAERSMEQLREEADRHLGDWLRRPLVEIRRSDCIERHRKMSEDSGSAVADRVMAQFRACWNSTRRRFEELLDHPVKGVTFNAVRRRREPVAWDDLPA